MNPPTHAPTYKMTSRVCPALKKHEKEEHAQTHGLIKSLCGNVLHSKLIKRKSAHIHADL